MATKRIWIKMNKIEIGKPFPIWGRVPHHAPIAPIGITYTDGELQDMGGWSMECPFHSGIGYLYSQWVQVNSDGIVETLGIPVGVQFEGEDQVNYRGKEPHKGILYHIGRLFYRLKNWEAKDGTS